MSSASKFFAAIVAGIIVGMLLCWFAQTAQAATAKLPTTAVRVWDGSDGYYSADFKVKRSSTVKVYVRSHGKWKRTHATRGGYRRGKLVVCCLRTNKTYKFVFRTNTGAKRTFVLRGGC